MISRSKRTASIRAVLKLLLVSFEKKLGKSINCYTRKEVIFLFAILCFAKCSVFGVDFRKSNYWMILLNSAAFIQPTSLCIIISSMHLHLLNSFDTFSLLAFAGRPKTLLVKEIFLLFRKNMYESQKLTLRFSDS